jgi:hypothetical protein
MAKLCPDFGEGMENQIPRPPLKLIKFEPTRFQSLMICLTSDKEVKNFHYILDGARANFVRNGRSYELTVRDLGPAGPGKEPA